MTPDYMACARHALARLDFYLYDLFMREYFCAWDDTWRNKR